MRDLKNDNICNILKSINNIKEMMYSLDFKSDFDLDLDINDRKELYDFFISYDIDGNAHDRFFLLNLITNDKNIKLINDDIYFQMSDKIKNIIRRCGVDPRNVVTYYGLNDRILCALYDQKTARVGEYVVKKSSDRPFDYNTPMLRSITNNKDELIKKYENGLSSFMIFENDNQRSFGPFLNIRESLYDKITFFGCLNLDDINSLVICNNDTLFKIKSKIESFENELYNYLCNKKTQSEVKSKIKEI